MPATRPSACSGCAWLRPDGDDAIPTTRALLPSVEASGPEPADARACGSRPPSTAREASLPPEFRETGGPFRPPFFGSSPNVEAGRSEDGEQGVGKQGEGYVPVPSMPASHLVVRESHLSLGLLEADLHLPSAARGLRQLLERGALGSEDRVGREFCGLFDRAAHEQPPLEAILHRRVERQPRPVVEARAFGAVRDRDAPEALLGDKPSFPENLEHLADAVLAPARPHVSLAREGQNVGLLPLFEEHPKPSGVAVDAVGENPRRLSPSVQCSPEHLLGKLGFGAHTDPLGHRRPFASPRIFGPLLRQIQLSVDEPPPPLRSVSQKHSDLAVLRLACGAGVLALDPGALVPLLDEARLVDDEDALLARQVFEYVAPQFVAHGVRVPIRSSQQVLDTVWRGVPRDLGQLPTILALGTGEQTAQIIPRPLARFGADEMRREALVHRLQFLGPRTQRFPIHRLGHHVLLLAGEDMVPNDHTIYNCSIRLSNRCLWKYTLSQLRRDIRLGCRRDCG